jgi:hypothetical protein
VVELVGGRGSRWEEGCNLGLNLCLLGLDLCLLSQEVVESLLVIQSSVNSKICRHFGLSSGVLEEVELLRRSRTMKL